MTRLSPDRRALVASNHEVFTVAPGDNLEAGDFFPSGSCDVLMLSEGKNVYRVLADRPP